MKRSMNTSYGRLKKPARIAKRAKVGPAVRQYVAKAVKRNLEVKYLDVAITPQPSAGGLVTAINNVPSGIDYNQRVGRHIKNSSLVVKCTTSTDRLNARYWIVYDKQSNGQTPSIHDIFEIGTSDTLTCNAQRNISRWADRFKILKTDNIFSLSSMAPDGVTAFTAVDIFLSLKDLDTEFYSNTTTISSGALYFVSTGTINAEGLAAGNFGGTVRLSFSDA